MEWCLWFLQGIGAAVPDVLHVVRLTACMEWRFCLFFVLQGIGAAVPDVLHVVHRTGHDPGLGGGHGRQSHHR